MATEKQSVERGEYDEDGALHLAGLDVIASTTRGDWPGASFSGEPEKEARRAHVTCPHCASANPADADVCWSCGAAL